MEMTRERLLEFTSIKESAGSGSSRVVVSTVHLYDNKYETAVARIVDGVAKFSEPLEQEQYEGPVEALVGHMKYRCKYEVDVEQSQPGLLRQVAERLKVWWRS